MPQNGPIREPDKAEDIAEVERLRQALAAKDSVIQKTDEALRTLSQKLEKGRRQLRRAHASLEKEIRERTEDLRRANRALAEELADHKRTERALRRSWSTLAEAQRIGRIGNWEWDVRTGNVAWSHEVFRILGIEPQEPSCELVEALTHPEDREFRERAIRRSLEGDAPFRIDCRAVRPDGSVVWIHSQAEIERGEGGRPLRMFGTAQDITERKEAEEALRVSQEQYRELVENIPDVAYRVEPDGTIAYVSPAVRGVLGYEPEELVGTHYARLVGEEDLEHIQNSFQDVLEGRLYPSEYRIRSKSGDLRWVRTHSRPRYEDGRLVGLQGVLCDVHERKTAEEALRRLGQEKSLILEATSELYAFCDVDLRVLWANKAAGDSVGRRAEDLIGRHCHEIWRGRRKPCADCPLVEVLATGKPQKAEVTCPDGRVWHRRGYPVLDEAGNVRNLVVFAQDVTERKRAEQERERLIRELAHRNAELERFTYTVSHDLKSPLITIRGFLGHLEADARQGDVELLRADVKRIGDAAGKMQTLLEDLLKLSRIGRVVNPPVETDLAELAREAAANIAGRIEQREVRLEIAPDLPVVRGDRARLTEVLQNLLDNAVKYMGDQPQPLVEVGVRRGDGGEVYFVRDNGIGIDPRHHQDVFGLFNQLDRGAEGTGVGLALTRRIIEVHGGRVWVESEGCGRGSTFCFTLPRTPHAPQRRGRKGAE